MQAQGLGGMGEMGSASVKASGKSGPTFEHILSRFQSELPKRQETDAGLHNLTGMICTIRSEGRWYVVLLFYYYLTP
jgi:hypothetical protein